MKTIIAATNLSPIAQNAARYASALSAVVGAELLLMHTIQIPVSISQIPYIVYNYDELTADAEKEMESLRTELLAQTAHAFSIRTQTSIGTPAHEINSLCNRKKPFTVVMGTETLSAGMQHIMGSPVSNTVHATDYPVLIVPEKASFNGFRKIAFATDLQAFTDNNSLNHLKDWLSAFHAELHIINVCSKKDIPAGGTAGAIDLQNELAAYHPVFHIANNPDIMKGVYDYLSGIEADLLIVQPHKHGFLESLFHKSQSKPFILHPRLPVLALPTN